MNWIVDWPLPALPQLHRTFFLLIIQLHTITSNRRMKLILVTLVACAFADQSATLKLGGKPTETDCYIRHAGNGLSSSCDIAHEKVKLSEIATIKAQLSTFVEVQRAENKALRLLVEELTERVSAGEKNHREDATALNNALDAFQDLDDALSRKVNEVKKMQGPKGERGIDGKDGEHGAKGERGTDGKDGIDGAKGEAGTDGNKGQKGEIGDDGFKGQKGEIGNDGSDGSPGSDGAKGEQGFKGDPGRDGNDGSDGSKGDTGAPGKDGDDGSDGSDGAKGEQGDPGSDGADGADGSDGRDGARGEPGSDGRKGDTGSPGAKGQKGAPGTNGLNGLWRIQRESYWCSSPSYSFFWGAKSRRECQTEAERHHAGYFSWDDDHTCTFAKNAKKCTRESYSRRRNPSSIYSMYA